jgi:alkylation response protein AidB-like acyl-CoA dehydrogenase
MSVQTESDTPVSVHTEPELDARAGADWIQLAAELAAEFASGVVEAERRGEAPRAELQRIRDTGLVNLLIPERFGGAGQNWQVVTQVIAELSRTDPNIGALLGYHFHNYYPAVIDTVTWSQDVQRASAANRWLWGHITDPVSPGCYATEQPDGSFRVNGVKRINTGAPTGDVMSIIVRREDRPEFLLGWLPTDREGVEIVADWDLLGMRRTETSTITFHDVVLEASDLFERNTSEPYNLANPYWQINASLAFGAVYVGAARGALDEARRYLLSHTDADPVTGKHPAKPDAPFILAEVGRLWGKVQSVRAYLAKAARVYDEAFARNPDAPMSELGHVRYPAEVLNLVAAKLAIEIGSRIFDITGASSTARKYGLDRFWRDIRTHSLHVASPIYKEQWTGAHYLTGFNPTIDFTRMPLEPAARANQ